MAYFTNLELWSGLWYNVSFLMCYFMVLGNEFDVHAKCVINATGPFTDSIRKMDNGKTPKICQPSAGVHIVIPGYYRSDPPVF